MGTYSNQNPMVPEANTVPSASRMAWFYPANYFTPGTSLNPLQGCQVNPTPGLAVTPIQSIASTTESVNCNVDPSGTSKSTKVKRQKSSLNDLDQVVRPKQLKKKASSSKKPMPETKREKKNPNIDMGGINFNFSGVPSPVCSCTGVARVCYKWGVGGWQSSCCTINISEYPLPMSSTRPGARMAGRKMSNGAYLKLLLRLAAEAHDLSHPVDLKEHWARHGTNKFVTIK